jgi:hypothetical protein
LPPGQTALVAIGGAVDVEAGENDSESVVLVAPIPGAVFAEPVLATGVTDEIAEEEVDARVPFS